MTQILTVHHRNHTQYKFSHIYGVVILVIIWIRCIAAVNILRKGHIILISTTTTTTTTNANTIGLMVVMHAKHTSKMLPLLYPMLISYRWCHNYFVLLLPVNIVALSFLLRQQRALCTFSNTNNSVKTKTMWAWCKQDGSPTTKNFPLLKYKSEDG